MKRALTVLLLALGVLVGGASTALADNHDAGIPGGLDDAISKGIDGLANTVQNDCPPEAPRVQDPQSGIAGAWMEPPAVFPPRKIAPDGLFAERGFGGMRTITYDLGCIRTPVDAAKQVQANLENDSANKVAGIGFAFTALAHDLDAKSWDTGWLFDIMADFAAEALADVNAGIVVPFVAAGLLVTTLVLLWRARKGESGPILVSTCWALTVLAIGAAVMTSPLVAPRLAQDTASGVTQTIYQTQGSPADVVTDRTFEAVHWRGLQRRYFGDQISPVTLTWFEDIVESTSWSWEEQAQIEADPAQEAVLWEAKMVRLDGAMTAIQENAPSDYADLSGMMRPRTDAAALEAAYAGSAGLFRIMAAGVRIMALLSLVILAFLWVASMPYLVTPAGEKHGKALLGNTVRAFALLAKSILGTFGFGIFAMAAMAPTVPMGTSFVLLILLTIIFWAMVRPDRAMLSMMTFGKVNASGRGGRMLSLAMQRRMYRRYLASNGRRRTA